MRTVRTRIALCAVIGLVPVFAGCEALIRALSPNTITVRLVNNSDYEVQATVFIGTQQDEPRETLRETGSRLDYTIAPGAAVSFSRNCEDLQAIVIDDSQLVVLGDIGPHANTSVQRDGSDFNCNDIITFTFDHSAIYTDFNIAVSTQAN